MSNCSLATFTILHEDGENIILSKVWNNYGIASLAFSTLSRMSCVSIPRNKDKLQAYQREYARQKRAPGRRKVSKAERALLEEQHVQRHRLMEMEDLLACSKAAFGQCACSSSCHFALTQVSRAYACALIVRSQAVDSRRTQDMKQEEERAREYFKEAKDILQLFCLCGWMDQFQKHVEDFIKEQLTEAANIMAVPGKEGEDSIRIHGLRRLVAGAVQEEELVRQPDYAATCAKLDRAIVWDGRGYVINTHLIISRLTHRPELI
jgi:hypothetical protein